jgi:hypothetical protein
LAPVITKLGDGILPKQIINRSMCINVTDLKVLIALQELDNMYCWTTNLC